MVEDGAGSKQVAVLTEAVVVVVTVVSSRPALTRPHVYTPAVAPAPRDGRESNCGSHQLVRIQGETGRVSRTTASMLDDDYCTTGSADIATTPYDSG